MITFFKFFPTECVLIKLNGSMGQIEACRVNMNRKKSYFIRGQWWPEDNLEKIRNKEAEQ